MSKSEIKRITHLAPELVKEIRDQALEEAARIADSQEWLPSSTWKLNEYIAAVIRSLKKVK